MFTFFLLSFRRFVVSLVLLTTVRIAMHQFICSVTFGTKHQGFAIIYDFWILLDPNTQQFRFLDSFGTKRYEFILIYDFDDCWDEKPGILNLVDFWTLLERNAMNSF